MALAGRRGPRGKGYSPVPRNFTQLVQLVHQRTWQAVEKLFIWKHPTLLGPRALCESNQKLHLPESTYGIGVYLILCLIFLSRRGAEMWPWKARELRQ